MGCEGIKPGWVRVNFNYFLSDPVVDYLIAAVAFVARHGHRLLGDYRFDVTHARWRHRRGLVEPPLRLGQLHYGADGALAYPRHTDHAPESDLERYLVDAAALVGAARGSSGDAQAEVSADFDALRWFDLPAACLE